MKKSLFIDSKELEDGSQAIGIFNLSDSTTKPIIAFSDLHIAMQQKLRDVWTHKDLGIYKNNISLSIPSHGVVLLKAKNASSAR